MAPVGRPLGGAEPREGLGPSAMTVLSGLVRLARFRRRRKLISRLSHISNSGPRWNPYEVRGLPGAANTTTDAAPRSPPSVMEDAHARDVRDVRHPPPVAIFHPLGRSRRAPSARPTRESRSFNCRSIAKRADSMDDGRARAHRERNAPTVRLTDPTPPTPPSISSRSSRTSTWTPRWACARRTPRRLAGVGARTNCLPIPGRRSGSWC